MSGTQKTKLEVELLKFYDFNANKYKLITGLQEIEAGNGHSGKAVQNKQSNPREQAQALYLPLGAKQRKTAHSEAQVLLLVSD